MLLILNTITILIVLVRMLIRLAIFNYNTLSEHLLQLATNS